MAIQAISFGQNDQVQKKNILPASAAGTVVLAGAGAATGYFTTKLNEDKFVRAAVADQEKVAQGEIKKAEKEIDNLLKNLEGENKKNFEEGSKTLLADIEARKELTNAEDKLSKAEKELAKLSDKDGKKLADVADDKFNKATKAVKDAKDAKDSAFTAYNEKVPTEKRFSTEQLKKRGEELKKAALDSLTGDNKTKAEAAQKVIAEKTPVVEEAKTAAAHLKETKDISKSENALVKKFKAMFTVKEGEKRSEEAEKLIAKLTKAAKNSKAMLYGGIGLAIGLVTTLTAYIVKNKKA